MNILKESKTGIVVYMEAGKYGKFLQSPLENTITVKSKKLVIFAFYGRIYEKMLYLLWNL
jgi:hypothetical protein